MIITPTGLTALFTNYSLAYQNAFTTAEIFWRTLATMMPSTTEANAYAWMEKIPKLREWIGPRQIQNVVARPPRIIPNRDFELTLEVPKKKIQDDQYGVYTPTAAMMGMQAAKWPDDVVAEKVLENPICYDGKAFFADDHPVDIDDASKGDYSNLETSFALNYANLSQARATMRGWQGVDGRRIGSRGSLLVVPPSLEMTAKTLLQSQYYPRLADGASLGDGDVAFAQNMLAGCADYLVIDDLEDEPADWYLLDTTKPILPFIFQLREAPVFTYLVNPSDANVFFNKNFVMGVEARGSADVTMPFLAFKGEG